MTVSCCRDKCCRRPHSVADAPSLQECQLHRQEYKRVELRWNVVFHLKPSLCVSGAWIMKWLHVECYMCSVRCVMALQSCPWVHFMWPNPTQPIDWLTQPKPTQPSGNEVRTKFYSCSIDPGCRCLTATICLHSPSIDSTLAAESL